MILTLREPNVCCVVIVIFSMCCIGLNDSVSAKSVKKRVGDRFKDWKDEDEYVDHDYYKRKRFVLGSALLPAVSSSTNRRTGEDRLGNAADEIFLCSGRAGFLTVEVIALDAFGISRKTFYSLKPQNMFVYAVRSENKTVRHLSVSELTNATQCSACEEGSKVKCSATASLEYIHALD